MSAVRWFMETFIANDFGYASLLFAMVAATGIGLSTDNLKVSRAIALALITFSVVLAVVFSIFLLGASSHV